MLFSVDNENHTKIIEDVEVGQAVFGCNANC